MLTNPISDQVSAKHSPLPWRDEFSLSGGIASADDCVIARVYQDSQDSTVATANAEFIVRACNAHEELLAALKTIAHLIVAKEDYEAAYEFIVQHSELFSSAEASHAHKSDL